MINFQNIHFLLYLYYHAVGWKEETKEITTSGLDSKIMVTGLFPSTSYHFRVMAENSFGKSDYSTHVTATTDSEGKLSKRLWLNCSLYFITVICFSDKCSH